MAPLAGIAINLVIGLVVSSAVKVGTALLMGSKRPSVARSTVTPPPKTTPLNEQKAVPSPLDVAPEPGGPLTGVFGSRRVGGRVRMSAVGTTTTKTFIHIDIAGAPLDVRSIFINNRLATIDGSENVSVSPYGAGALKVKLYDGTQTTADAATLAGVSGYTADHKGLQIPYARIITDTAIGSNVFSGGLPDFTFQVDGFKCYDPRDETHDINTPSTWDRTSSNPAIQCANYLIHVLGANFPKTMIDWESCARCADICDESVEVQPGGVFESRYSGAPTWRTDEDHDVVLTRIGSAMGGGAFLIGKKYVFTCATPPGAGINITPDDYEGDALSFADTPSIGARYNGVRGTFCSPFHNYELRDFPAYQDAAALAADRGVPSWLDLKFETVLSHSQAQRLGRVLLRKARDGYPASVDLNFGFFDVVADDVVNVTDDLAGMTAEKFRVIEEQTTPDLTVQLELQRDDASFYSWAIANEQAFVALAPVGTIPDGSTGTGWTATFDASALIPGGGVLYDSEAGAYVLTGTSGNNHPDNVTALVKLWDSPSESAINLNYEILREYRVKTTTGGGAITYQDYSTTAALSEAATSASAPWGNDNLPFGGTSGKITDNITLKMRTKNVATGDVTPYRNICTNITIPDIDAKAVASSPYYVLPGCRYPTIANGAAGFITLGVPTQAGDQSPTIEFFVNTVDNFSTATLLGSVTNNGSSTLSYSKPTATTRYFWARIANGAVKGPESNVVQVVFA